MSRKLLFNRGLSRRIICFGPVLLSQPVKPVLLNTCLYVADCEEAQEDNRQNNWKYPAYGLGIILEQIGNHVLTPKDARILGRVRGITLSSISGTPLARMTDTRSEEQCFRSCSCRA